MFILADTCFKLALLYFCLCNCLFYEDVLQPGVQTVVTTPQTTQQQAPMYAPQPTPMPMPMPMPGYSQTTGYPMYTAQAGNKLLKACISCYNHPMP